MLDWCGVSESTVAVLHDTGFDDEATRRHLDRAEDLGRRAFTSSEQIEQSADVTLMRGPHAVP